MSTTPTAPSESVSAGLAGLRALDDQEVTDELHAVERQIRELQARRALVVTEVVGRIEAIGGQSRRRMPSSPASPDPRRSVGV